MRVTAGVAGVVLMGVGVWSLLYGAAPQDPWPVVRWLAGAVVVHDGIVAPLTLAVGWAVTRLPARRVVRGTLLVMAGLTAVAYPVLFRPGPRQNASVLPLDYGRNWAVVMAVTVLVGVGVGWLRWWRRGRPRK
ncbi:hypothetical protein LKL35_20755 [Streptomyces sp. ET3-23]|uniref:hypothetical protein n=1 Tax=Streptomyces sp. ET3-23 TaxID=2885643 RepID=UPI001D129745|nr:hypothetical protein [Streptomyces sp. ET3-23]MCC2277832.1 hypothetical protein [Streptomyces sp. ET3-23]